MEQMQSQNNSPTVYRFPSKSTTKENAVLTSSMFSSKYNLMLSSLTNIFLLNSFKSVVFIIEAVSWSAAW